ncbi:MAG: hypothetical protein WBD07_04465 [Vicinamibacterales bacterium]
MALSDRVFAQGWSGDARKLALGGVGTTQNLASEMIEKDPKYRSIVIPLGLLQLVGNFDKFDPNSDNFDPIRGLEYVANPYHITFGRNEESAGRKIVTDIFNQRLSTNLNDYRGFIPSANPKAEGILSFDLLHKTFKFSTSGNSYQGFYVGIGPYFTHRTSLTLDQKLIDILSATGAPLTFPNSQFDIALDRSTTQMAGALTFGYRARVGLPAGLPARGTDREGVYVAVNYRYLRGFHLEDIGLKVRADTDGAGNITLDPLKPLAPCPLTSINPGVVPPTFGTPFCTDRQTSSSGSGRSVDFGVATVFGPWEVGFGINGVTNKMEWSDVKRESYGLAPNIGLTSGTSGASIELEKTDLGTVNDLTIEQPSEVLANAAYRARFGTILGEVGHGYQGTSFGGGVEGKLGPFMARGGMRYSNEKWNPTTGLGFDFFPRLGIDVAFLTSTANAEKKHNPVLAVSLRINAGS